MSANDHKKNEHNMDGMPKDGNRAPVTIIGLGMMGSALARAFLKEGHPTTVWNRAAGKAGTLAAMGAAVAGTAAEAVAASPLVVICVLDYEVMNEILASAGGILSGRVLVNLTNGTPAQARNAAAWAARQGAEYLDGGIMAVPQMIGAPGALVLYSGSPSSFTMYQQSLESLGASHYVGEDPGLASLYDLALLSAMFGMFGGFFQAVAMVRAEMIPASVFTPLVIPWLSAMMNAFPRMAQAVDTGEHGTDVSSLNINKSSFVNLIEASRDLGLSADLMTPLQALVNRGVAEGYGADGLSRLVELIRRPIST
ncbi:NAD(P)-dependent oxidoreductase [Paenibacillus allorhizosphaerae]|uniref:NAD(P)-dependent oxidoreductase n=1 Tax=Paenibacillus allorhizosphaerae TaxID=2849866 RepID=A0ABM8VPL2_9BACL|nr:NAD(P)-binding domain-containing protein [Paenibacillus allorhizosphaerae]CAG7653067.1 hypothetical protein PAECIP111802_05388 [Paenibacillus allorhizosphaerae]